MEEPTTFSARIRLHRAAILVTAVFALMHALQFMPNHWLFRTHALDLGLYTHAAYEYAHGRIDDCLLFLPHAQPILADHFDLQLMLWSPLTYLFGTWTLLIVQWFAIALGGWGMYRWLLALGAGRTLAVLGQVHFLAFFGIYSALAFDFHSNVVATMALPWFGLAIVQGRMGRSWWLLLFTLVAKENMGFWLFAVTLGFGWAYRADRRLRKHLLMQGTLALGWSMLIIGVVMPALAADGHYAGWKYPALGGHPGQVWGTLLFHPGWVVKAMFTDTIGVPHGQAIKCEMLALVLISGGWAFFRRPWILLMAVPILAQKLLHRDPIMWGVFAHYSIELAPLCTLAVFGLLSRWKWQHAAVWVGVASVIMSFAATIYTMDGSIVVEERSRQRIYQAQHYHRDFDVSEVRAAINTIPDDAAVSATYTVLPAVCLRQHVYEYPIVRDARYIVLLPKEEQLGVNDVELRQRLDTLRASLFWRPLVHSEAVELYERIAP